MKLLVKLLSIVFAVGIILTLGMQAQGGPILANPYKANHQQFERFHEPVLVVNSESNRTAQANR
ncbi:hypothetical protein OB236_34480 [Paenibacillus sp. WQ 127069]|uniref:Phosphatase n=1 Tax=Paenibacillus baimaensis TaxID=2982185 RepID=A0ABT2URF8_9BACL|nr:hypothetical protein [Paenibacillus sp. WQ 127069]MCU6797248.1 hypothetical protein [Paenibacillus sp. WQ 127069]